MCFVEVCGCMMKFMFLRFVMMLWMEVGDRCKFVLCDSA